MSVEFYSRLERGRAHPSLEVLLRMLDVLGVSADTLLGLDAARAAAPVEIPLTSPDDPIRCAAGSRPCSGSRPRLRTSWPRS